MILLVIVHIFAIMVTERKKFEVTRWDILLYWIPKRTGITR